MCTADEPDAGRWGGIDAVCLGCDKYKPVDYLGLCATCASWLERDRIRQWD